ncbi:hypothetical protein VTJ04DRAFT_3402 [Mycothermus thermophilus]|uniref:uncharacterized protein n=1 Tax=Humicola insolens TaxID=85995 RepID=UPI0037449D44
MPQLPFSPLLRAWYKWKMLRLPWRRKFLIGFDLQGNTYWEFLDRGAPRPPPPSSPSSPSSPSTRWRRILKPRRSTPFDSVTVPPAWHQWLRHTRADPPSLEEQAAEVERQARIKVLAAQADARWEAKPRLTDAPTAAPGEVPGLPGVGGAVREMMTGASRRGHAEGAELEAAEAIGEADAARDEVQVGGKKTTTTKADVNDVGILDRAGTAAREETWRKMQEEEAAAAKDKKKTMSPGQPSPWDQARRGPGEAWQPQAWEPKAKEKR